MKIELKIGENYLSIESAGRKYHRALGHEVFDPIWKNGDMSQQEAYAWLAGEMGINKAECHFSQFGPEQCRQAIAICVEYHRALSALKGALANKEAS